MNISRTPNRTTTASLRQTETLSSGLRVKRAANDASGLVVSEGFRSQFTRLAQNVRNAENANDLLQVAESSLNEASRMLQRMRDLAVLSADGHINDDHPAARQFRSPGFITDPQWPGPGRGRLPKRRLGRQVAGCSREYRGRLPGGSYHRRV